MLIALAISSLACKNDEEREEGGTPSIAGSVRAILMLQLPKA